MMQGSAASEPGAAATPSEDWHHVDRHLAVVLDGATVRTDTGCVHGVPWYVEHLGTAIVNAVHARPRASLTLALRQAITEVAAMHPDCDLTHPGTPSAGVAVVLDLGEVARWLVLGDVSIAIDTGSNIEVVVDNRVSRTAAAAREEADKYPIGSKAKAEALVRMKTQELAARNTPQGYWIAAAEPNAADHALTGSLTDWQHIAVLTDGAARARDFDLMRWPDLFKLLDAAGPVTLIHAVRDAESTDPDGERWPRNKRSDDATAVYLTRTQHVIHVGDPVRSQWNPALTGRVTERIDHGNLRIRWNGTPSDVQMPANELFVLGKYDTTNTRDGDPR